MATKTLWSEWQVTSVNPEIRSTVICNYERVGTQLKISITTKNHMTSSGAWRYNRWAMNISINGQQVATNYQIKPRTYSTSGTKVYEVTTPTYTVEIGGSDSVPISIFYFDTGWGSAYNVVTKFKTLTASLTGIPSLPNVSISANQSYPNKTHNSLRVNYSVSGSYDYVRVYVDGNHYADVNTSPFTINGLSANSNHNVYAKAYGSGGFGANSNNISFTTYLYPVSVGDSKVGDIQPFSCSAYITSSNANDTEQYEFALCNANKQVVQGAFTTKNTYYNFSGLAEETSYCIRYRVQTKGSGAWSDYIYSPIFKTPADIVRSYIQLDGGTCKKGKTYFKNPENGEWQKVKKAWVKINGEWKISINKY